VVAVKKYENPDIKPESEGLTEAKRALELPKRAPTDEDRPRRNGYRPRVIEGQMSVFDVLEEDRR
jgi:hypothetical protein